MKRAKFRGRSHYVSLKYGMKVEDSLMQLVSREHIEISSDVQSGKPRIADTRIAVEEVAMMHLKLGYSLIEIASKYDLSLASVYAAMAFIKVRLIL
ncbi:DUF433 domain-containing protein [uncultured Nostoc sp.]|uniref:DUF433 domain-containing protein n=1 Tax=uncultured Nostoc sp. TaxID=340711 RepID=UPI0035CC0044